MYIAAFFHQFIHSGYTGLIRCYSVTQTATCVCMLCIACVCVWCRCATSDALDLLFYSSKRLSWGVRFAVPKFQAFDSLHVTCRAYVCDSAGNASNHCDRSCITHPRTTTTSTTTTHVARGRRDAALTHQLQTEFTVADNGFGPLIDAEGNLWLIPQHKPRQSLTCIQASLTRSQWWSSGSTLACGARGPRIEPMLWTRVTCIMWSCDLDLAFSLADTIVVHELYFGFISVSVDFKLWSDIHRTKRWQMTDILQCPTVDSPLL